MTAPPIAASAETKFKLKAFHFADDPQKSAASDEQKAGPDNSDKENQFVVGAGTSVVGVVVEGATQPHTQNGPSRVRRDCPQTPLSRLPLADLIGSTEDPTNRAGLELTPDERVYWNHSPHSSDNPSSSATPAPRRRNKRARSSSPASSSQKEVSSHLVSKRDLDLDQSQRALKTPQADPATDLWNRYAIGADNLPAQSGQQFPAFAHLIESPSSHLANAILAKDGSGLRRSLSGGFEFGSSKAKRRRINNVFGAEKDDDMFSIPPKDANNKKPDPRMARVSSLVEKIQEDFLKTRSGAVGTAPSSSSPFPEGADNMVPPLSPPREDFSASRRGPDHDMRESVMADGPDCDAAREVTGQPHKAVDTSSEYDDDDIDLDLLLSVEESADTHQAMQGSRPQSESIVMEPWRPTNLTGYGGQDHNALGLLEMGDGKFESATITRVIPDVRPDEFDGFEDDDNDKFAADLEDVVAMYDVQAGPGTGQIEAHLGSRGSPQDAAGDVFMEDSVNIASGDGSRNEVAGGSDDEFGDYIDFEQLAVEFTATQGAQRGTPSHIAVCTRSFAPST